MRILFKFPSRSRHDRFFFSLNNITEKIDDKVNYQILCSLDLDDYSMRTEESMAEIKKYSTRFNIICEYDDSRNKIHAVNRNLEFIGNKYIPIPDIIICWSDDMEAIEQGFDNAIRRAMEDSFPDLDGCLHYNDGWQGETICTLAIMGKKYFDRFGYIYHPDYISVYADTEYTRVARQLGRIKYFPQIIVRHNHPNFTKAMKDALLKKTESYYGQDLETLQRREKINFGL